jgi:hypothetical protein
MSETIATSIPETVPARDATELVGDATDDLLFNDCLRVYLWGTLQGRPQGVAADLPRTLRTTFDGGRQSLSGTPWAVHDADLVSGVDDVHDLATFREMLCCRRRDPWRRTCGSPSFPVHVQHRGHDMARDKLANRRSTRTTKSQDADVNRACAEAKNTDSADSQNASEKDCSAHDGRRWRRFPSTRDRNRPAPSRKRAHRDQPRVAKEGMPRSSSKPSATSNGTATETKTPMRKGVSGAVAERSTSSRAARHHRAVGAALLEGSHDIVTQSESALTGHTATVPMSRPRRPSMTGTGCNRRRLPSHEPCFPLLYALFPRLYLAASVITQAAKRPAHRRRGDNGPLVQNDPTRRH